MSRDRFIQVIAEHLLRIVAARLTSPAERLAVASMVFVVVAKMDGLDRAKALEAAGVAFDTLPALREPAHDPA